MKKLFFVLIAAAVFAVWFFFFKFQDSVQIDSVSQKIETETQDQAVDWRASFLIFTNGTKRIFTNAKYHNLSPDVYIEAASPAIVHVKKQRITWSEFFETLPMQMTGDCLTTGAGEKYCNLNTKILKFYLNGAQVRDFFTQEIKDGDWAMISYGGLDEKQIMSQLKQAEEILVK